MEKVRPWCGQPSDRGRLKNRTVRITGLVSGLGSLVVETYIGYYRLIGR